MTSAIIRVQQAGGNRFSLECLYNIAHAKEKVARQLFAKEALMTAAADTATSMSSITDADKFTTVSLCGVGSSSSPPKQRPQSYSPPHPGDDIKRINPFDDSFLTSFPPLDGCAPALPGETGNLSDPDQQKRLEELMVLASPCAALIVGTGQDGHTKNTPRGNVTKNSFISQLYCTVQTILLVITHTVQGYFWRTRLRPDAIRVIGPDR
jgi:hypothetical protein